jgi:hypothetical protein
MVTALLVLLVTVAPFVSYWKFIPDTVDACTDVGAKYSTAASSAVPKKVCFFIFSSLIENRGTDFAVKWS